MDLLQINNRRYLGNKYKLLGALRTIVEERCGHVESFTDIFAGTGSVASAFIDVKLILNDILYSNYICHIAWFSNQRYSSEKVKHLIDTYNLAVVEDDNYMSENFADTYFSKDDCRFIGYVRQDIEDRFVLGEINQRERALLITSLLYAMDKVAHTVGHYDAYRKGVSSGRHLNLRLPHTFENVREDNEFYNEDANELAKRLVTDVMFMDPPYNSRQYSDAYHLLENVARWEKPPVKGVARKMDRTTLKSEYCTRRAERAFADLVSKVRSRWIMLTYNNMADQGNDRSNARLSDEAIMKVLSAKGDVEVFNVAHKAFSAGNPVRNNNEERVFLCRCREAPLVASPLNYTGGKFKLLSQLMPRFPRRIRKGIDLFSGGCNVGINLVANEVVLNDNCRQLMAMLRTIKELGGENFEMEVEEVIDRFGLSNSDAKGYDFYGCESGTGLSSYNREPYIRLRDYYSQLEDGTRDKSVVLYVLVVYAFNNQIRFNSHEEFNLPVGKRDFNSKMKAKLRAFAERLNERNFRFLESDFRNIDLSDLGVDDFVYVDPPYLVTTASYNENGGWSAVEERKLLTILDQIHAQHCRFALSNVTESNGRVNEILNDWLEHHRGEYHIVEIARSYKNSNYHRKNVGNTREILVVNYLEET